MEIDFKDATASLFAEIVVILLQSVVTWLGWNYAVVAVISVALPMEFWHAVVIFIVIAILSRTIPNKEW